MNKQLEENYDKGAKFERKQSPTFIKAYDEEKGIVEHFIAIAGNVDLGEDRIKSGAFFKSISERGPRVKVLDQHAMDSVTRIVGRPLSLREVDRGELTPEVLSYAPDATGALLATTQYAIDTTRGRDVFNLVKGGYAPEFSIGYDALEVDFVKETGPDGKERTVRELKQCRLWEYSSVIFGMNPATGVLSAKSVEDESPEEKAGRVLSARNFARLQAAMSEIHACLTEAGLVEAAEEIEEMLTTGPQQSEVTPTSDAKEAGPQQEASTRYLKLIEIEQEALKLLEV
jgi:HK97 family phage prohead protease